MQPETEEKLERLRMYLRRQERVAVAFSAGVDSALLLSVAHEELGERTLAVTMQAAAFPKREAKEAEALCREMGVAHEIGRFEPLQIKGFVGNVPERCYVCKRELFKQIRMLANKHGMDVVLEGSNADDVQDYRPGMRALLELGIQSPLLEAGLTKAEIRLLARERKLSVWDKPSLACLASRIAYGEQITAKKLQRIEEAEQLLQQLGFRQLRVRLHGELARIEVPFEELGYFMKEDVRTYVLKEFRELGFHYVTVDLAGFRSGSMNEMLQEGR